MTMRINHDAEGARVAHVLMSRHGLEYVQELAESYKGTTCNWEVAAFRKGFISFVNAQTPPKPAYGVPPTEKVPVPKGGPRERWGI